MVEINWTYGAIQDLEDIGEYIARDSIKYAELTVEKLFTSVDILEENPKLGRIVPEFDNTNIRELIQGNYRVVYEIISKNSIDILTVQNSSRLLENIFNFNKEE
jgi:toxin ParE1/3/4